MKKKTIFILPFLMLVSLLSVGQTTKHISFDFNMNDFEIQQDEAGNTIILSKAHDYFLKSDTLLPALPYIGYNILIGSAEKYESHVSSESKSLFQNNVILAQNPKVIPTNMTFPTNEVKPASYSSRIYPTEHVEYVGMNECADYRILSFHVSPFEYDATTQKLYLRTHIDLNINLAHSSPISSTSTRNRELVRNAIRQMVVNPEDMDGHNVLAVNSVSDNNLMKQTGFEYVIVTSDKLKNTFQKLANWKSRKGIRSKVLTVEHIDSTYTGTTTKEKIKNALDSISGLSYVLLGGDTLNVPTCMVYIGSYEGTDSITPADVYYSCLHTKNWDTNGNGRNGDIDDEISMIPTLNVSRAPVSTITDAQVFVDRIINYESAPDTTNWEDNILMCGNSIGDIIDHVWIPAYNGDGYSDSQIWSQMIYYQCIDSLWEDENCTFFYDTYTNINGKDASNYDFTAKNLQTELQKGYTFVDVMTHGDKYLWCMEHGNNYHDDAKHLENHGYSVITTTSCHTNAFDYYGKCLSQNFINNPKSGILAYLGTSRENWFANGFRALGNGPEFDTLTYNKIFMDNYHRIGKAVTEVKQKKMEEGLGPGYHSNRLIWMGLNLMGDPEMPIFIHKPKSFQNISIQFVNDSIYIDAGVGDFDICFINQNDSTDYYIVRNIADSKTVFSRIDGVFDVCITKPGYIPYITTCGNTYIQNTTLVGTNTYKVGNAFIGSDVTNKIAQGPVIVNSGNSTIKTSQGVTITKDFEVKLGAEFTITNE